MGGNNSCNHFFGTYEIEGNRLSLQPLGESSMLCHEALMHHADLVNKTLPLVVTAKMDQGKLILLDETGKEALVLSKNS